MKTLKFYGYSDDTFGEYGVTDTDYDNCSSGESVTFKVTAHGKALFVTGQYSRNNTGCWDVGVSIEDENNCPEWDMRIYFEDYSTVLEIDVPDDFTLECILEGSED